MSNIIDKIQLSGVTYDIGGGGGTVSSAITSGDTNAVAGGAVYDKFDEVEQVTAAALNDINDRVSEDEEVTAAALNALNTNKQDKLSAGTGISISGNVISATGGGGGNPTVELTQAEYDALVTAGTVSADTYYIITDATPVDMSNYYTTAQTNSLLSGKQNTLVSGTNIKTINNESILGSGNISVEGKTIEAGRGISVATGATADTISVSLPISAGTGMDSIKENNNANIASGLYSHAEGSLTIASGRYSHAEGFGTIANNDLEHASGFFNVSNTGESISAQTLFSVGNGAFAARHNAFEIRQNGDIYISSGGTDIKLQDSLGGTVSSAITSGDTNAVAGGAVYDRFDEVEQVTAQALNVLNDRLDEDEEVTAAALNNLNEALSGKQDTLIAGANITISGNVISATGGGGGGTVESAITSGSTNAVESKAIWSATTYNKEVTLQWDNGFPSKLSTNYPSGCKKFVVTVPSNNNAMIMLCNGGSPLFGHITINNWGSVTVSIDTFEGITYTISGNDVTFVVPDTIAFDQLQTDIRSITSIKAIVEGVWIADNTYMKLEVDTIQNTLQNNINQKLDSTAYTPVNVDSALIENSTNPVEGGVLYDELVYKGAASETEIQWSGAYSTNYPSGCTEIKVEVSGINNGMSIDFYDDNWQRFGNVNINNWGGISVYFNGLQGATYEISGPIVTISYPSVTGVTKINSSGTVTYTTKAVTYGASTTVKDALGGLKFVKLTQTEYDNLQTKDNNTLYVIVN